MVAARAYLIGGVALAFLALLAGLLWFRAEAASAAAERDQARSDVKTAVAVNASQQAVMDRLTEYRKVDDKLLTDLQGRLGEIASSAGAATSAIRELEKTSADVKTYLATPVPADLKRMLDGRSARGGAAARQ